MCIITSYFGCSFISKSGSKGTNSISSSQLLPINISAKPPPFHIVAIDDDCSGVGGDNDDVVDDDGDDVVVDDDDNDDVVVDDDEEEDEEEDDTVLYCKVLVITDNGVDVVCVNDDVSLFLSFFGFKAYPTIIFLLL